MKQKIYDISAPGIIHRLGRLVFSAFASIVFKTYVRVEAENRHLLPSGPFIICSNHQSHLDSIVLAHIAHPNFNHTGLIAAKDYWFDHTSRYRFASLFFNLIPISRNSRSNRFDLVKTKKIVNDFIADPRKKVVILPEGTRGQDGRIRTFKKGVTVLSTSLQLPVVPVYIEGTGKLWPKGSYFIKPGKVRLRIGAPIRPDELNREDSSEIVRQRIIALKNDGETS